MDLRKLRHAVILAEEGGFARAAARMHITQPALTRSIQALEGELGLKLFERLSSGVKVTVGGQPLLAKARLLLRDARGIEREAELIRNASAGHLTVGMAPVPARLLLPSVMPNMLSNSDGIAVDVDVQAYGRLLVKLLADALEFFVSNVAALEHRQDLSIRPLGDLPLGFFVRSGHPLAGMDIQRREALLPYPLVTHGLQGSFEVDPQTNSSLVASGRWKNRFTCDDVATLKTLALETDALLVTARHLVQGDIDSGCLQTLAGPLFAETRITRLGVVQLPHRRLSPLAERMIGLLAAELARLPG